MPTWKSPAGCRNALLLGHGELAGAACWLQAKQGTLSVPGTSEASTVPETDRKIFTDWRWAALLHGLVVVVLTVVVWQSSVHLPPAQEFAPQHRPISFQYGEGVLRPWAYWDGGFYARIAEDGYPAEDRLVFARGGETLVAFLPGYPLLAGGIARLGMGTGLGLLMTTLAAGFGATIALHGWFTTKMSLPSARWASLTVAAFPWAYFLVAAAYGEALFLLLAVAAFLCAERDRPVAAGLLAAAASLTRLVGIGVVLGVALRVAERRGALTFVGWRPCLDLSKFRRRDTGLLVGISGLGGWMLYCWIRYGDPLAFSTAQRGWNGGIGLNSLLKLNLLDQLQNNTDRGFVARLVAQGVVMIAFALALPAVWRRFGAGYGTYALVVVALSLLGSGNFASHGRFALMIFPVFGLVGERLASERTLPARAVLVVSGVALVLVTSLWGRGHWMA